MRATPATLNRHPSRLPIPRARDARLLDPRERLVTRGLCSQRLYSAGQKAPGDTGHVPYTVPTRARGVGGAAAERGNRSVLGLSYQNRPIKGYAKFQVHVLGLSACQLLKALCMTDMALWSGAITSLIRGASQARLGSAAGPPLCGETERPALLFTE